MTALEKRNLILEFEINVGLTNLRKWSGTISLDPENFAGVILQASACWMLLTCKPKLVSLHIIRLFTTIRQAKYIQSITKKTHSRIDRERERKRERILKEASEPSN